MSSWEPIVRGMWAEWRSKGETVPVDFRRSAGALDVMEQTPILGVIGANGGGKSMLAVLLCMRSLAAGRRVVSTVRLVDWENLRPCPGGSACDDPEFHETKRGVHSAAHPLYIKWQGWGQLWEMASEVLRTEQWFDVFADEVTGVAGSRDSTSLPKVAQNALVQLRRGDSLFRWTAPAAGRADLLLREVSQGIATAVGYRSVVDATTGRRWPRRRLFHWVLRDVRGFPDFTWSQLLEADVVADAWYWGPASPVQQAYDTFAPVATVGRITGHGTCETCEGTRRRQECTCPDYLEEKAAAARARAGGPGDSRGTAHDRGPAELVVGRRWAS